MNIGVLWDQFSTWIMRAGLPTVGVYHLLCASSFFNVAAEDAEGLERVGNYCLVPAQYLFAGRLAKPIFSEQKELVGYVLEQRFSYEDPALWYKTFAAYCIFPSSTLVGTLLKSVSYLSPNTRERQEKIIQSARLGGTVFSSKNPYYESCGIQISSWEETEKISSLGYERRPGDADRLQAEKNALKEIVALLREYNIVHWLDCGTCLGAYRYGGNIPWDWDVDIAILQPDFGNVRHVLSFLDPKKYSVQDWSSRDNPETYLKVYVKETDSLIDIYHFAVNAEDQTIQSILSNGESVFLPESWKIRERRFVIPTPFSFVFPLKKIDFDGIEAFIPANTKKYLQQRYGENIEPAKIYDASTGQYEKDLNHPYWKELYTR
jgi:hypothetical protein